MSTVEVKVPDIGDFKDVPVIDIMVKPGDSVKAEDSLVSLESDKATMDVPAPLSGVVKAISVNVGDKVSEGSMILSLATGEATAAPAAAAAVAAAGAAQPSPTAPAAASSTAGPSGAIDEAAFALARLRRAEAGLRGGPQAGDEAVRRVLEQASPESVRWLASRAVSYMDESGYPEAVEPWFQALLDPNG